MRMLMFMKLSESAVIALTFPILPNWFSLRRSVFALTMSLLLVSTGSSALAGDETKSQSRVRTFATILPIAYFVERIGGSDVEVSVLVGSGQDPHTFDPTPRLMAKLADAQILFKIGFPFEEALIKKIVSTFKNVWVVDVQQGIALRTMTEAEAGAEHTHGHGKKHNHSRESELDLHTWLNPQLAKIQARTIADALIRLDPSRTEQYENNLKDFHVDLDSIHGQLTKALAPLKDKSFFVFHPAYGYFGDAYGLRQISVQLAGKEPTARQLARLIKLAKNDGVRIIFVQPQFSKKSAEVLAKAIGGAVVPLDDLSRDYLKNLRDMAAEIEAALSIQEK